MGARRERQGRRCRVTLIRYGGSKKSRNGVCQPSADAGLQGQAAGPLCEAFVISGPCGGGLGAHFDHSVETIDMRYALFAFALAALGATAASGPDQFGESCSGTETVQVGANAPKVVPYALKFSADLAAGYYCYAQCKPQQTYAIKDHTSDPIKLADLRGNQDRLLTFDRRTAVLTDHQVIRLLGVTTRNAKAICRPAAFHKPTPLPGE